MKRPIKVGKRPINEGKRQLRFGVFRKGVFQKMPAFGAAISEGNFCEICRRKSPQNTEKHKTKLCAEVPERPLPKDPFFQLLNVYCLERGRGVTDRGVTAPKSSERFSEIFRGFQRFLE